MSDRFQEAEKLFKEKLGVDEIDPKATLLTYGLDSLDVMDFLLGLEDKFNIRFEINDLKDVKTIGELLELVKKQLK